MKKARKINNLLLLNAENLTLADRRFFNYLLRNAFDNLTKHLEFEIKPSELGGVYGLGLPSLEKIKESSRRLIKTLIEIETANKEWILLGLFEKLKWIDEDSTLIYSYSDECRTIFLDPILLEKCLIQAHFTQKYSNLLYELLASTYYENQLKCEIDILDLRGHLQISENKLGNFSDLDRFVLAPACKEINSHASFLTRYTTKRKGMKVTHVIFEMEKKRDIATSASAKEVIPPKRPRLFIENPETEAAYAFMLNAETKVRRKFFDLALKRANKQKQVVDEEMFDRPDLWFTLVEADIIKKMH